jgi:hypothetical protein
MNKTLALFFGMLLVVGLIGGFQLGFLKGEQHGVSKVSDASNLSQSAAFWGELQLANEVGALLLSGSIDDTEEAKHVMGAELQRLLHEAEKVENADLMLLVDEADLIEARDLVDQLKK